MPQVAKQKVVGPYSKAIQRGAIGDLVDGRTKEGKLLRRVEKELHAALNRTPTFSETLLIRRICRMTLQLELLDRRIADETEYDGRVYGALGNQIRLALRDLGIKPAALADAPPSLATIAARHKGAQ